MTFIPLNDVMIYYEDSERVMDHCLAFIKELRKMTDLLPCPFCGGEALLTELPLSQGWPLWFIRCQGCKLESPEKQDDDEAVRWWNTRVGKEPNAKKN